MYKTQTQIEGRAQVGDQRETEQRQTGGRNAVGTYERLKGGGQ